MLENSFDNIEIFSDTDADLYFIISKTALPTSRKVDNLETSQIHEAGFEICQRNLTSRRNRCDFHLDR